MLGVVRNKSCCRNVEMHDGDHYHLPLTAKPSQLSIQLSLSVERIIIACCPFEIKPVHPSNFSVYIFLPVKVKQNHPSAVYHCQ